MALLSALILKKMGMGWGEALSKGSGGIAGQIARTVEAGREYQKTPEYKKKKKEEEERKRKKKLEATLKRLQEAKSRAFQRRSKGLGMTY